MKHKKYDICNSENWNEFENFEYFITLSTFNNYMHKYLNKNFKMTLNLVLRYFFNVTAYKIIFLFYNDRVKKIGRNLDVFFKPYTSGKISLTPTGYPWEENSVRKVRYYFSKISTTVRGLKMKSRIIKQNYAVNSVIQKSLFPKKSTQK